MPNTDLASGGSERSGTRPVPETFPGLGQNYFMGRSQNANSPVSVKNADQVLQPYWTYKTHIAVPTLRKCFSMVGIFYIKNAHVHGEDIHAILHCIYFCYCKH